MHVNTSLVQVGLKSTRDSHMVLSSQFSLSPETGLPVAAEETEFAAVNLALSKIPKQVVLLICSISTFLGVK